MHTLKKMYRGETTWDFIGSRKRWYAASATVLLICFAAFLLRGFNMGVEFSGGTQFQITVTGTPIDPEDVESAFHDAGVEPAAPPREVGSSDTRQIVVKTETLTQTRVQELRSDLTVDLGIEADRISSTSISSSWGKEVTNKSIRGLIVFLIAVSIYLSIRFQWRYALGAFFALIHDLIVTAGVYSLVGFEVTPSTVVGLLTILGFSLYDTVVVYDKVAENAKDLLAGSRMTYGDAANLAVNQTLMRSINTSLIALLPVAGLLFVGAGMLGVGTIKDLALVLFVGLASGAYSSLFLATPFVVDLTERDPQYKALARRVADKRATEAKRAAEAEVVTASATSSAAAPKRVGGPAPAPKPGARPQQRPRRK